MAKKSTKELMEEKSKKLNTVSPSQALFGMATDSTNNREEKGTEPKEVVEKEGKSAATEEREEITKSVPNEENEKSEKKHQILSFKKQKIEDTHTRSTFLVRNELLARFDKLAKGKHGFKTEFINYAIESALNEIEEEMNR
ncbi:hypothetical protein [Ornithinibacillus contaminans]|uniref:hypothetical protein n=1 Tax=Ornithinibacillus contaminans TaxID=694055 RepID=UPI00064DA4F7|nr:hypothetical protein [Ornithinibacillus contaminans]